MPALGSAALADLLLRKGLITSSEHFEASGDDGSSQLLTLLMAKQLITRAEGDELLQFPSITTGGDASGHGHGQGSCEVHPIGADGDVEGTPLAEDAGGGAEMTGMRTTIPVQLPPDSAFGDDDDDADKHRGEEGGGTITRNVEGVLNDFVASKDFGDEPSGSIHEAIMLRVTEPNSSKMGLSKCVGVTLLLLCMALSFIQVALLNLIINERVNPPCKGQNVFDHEGAQCRGGEFCAWGYKEKGVASFCTDCAHFHLWNASVQQPLSEKAAAAGNVQQQQGVTDVPAVYMANAWKHMCSADVAGPEFIIENYVNLRTPTTIVLVIVFTLLVPSTLVDDTDAAAFDQHLATRRIRMIEDGVYRDFVLFACSFIYWMRTYVIPVSLVTTTSVLFMADSITVTNVCLNSLAVMFVNGLDDIICKIFVQPTWRAFVGSVHAGFEEQECCTLPYRLNTAKKGEKPVLSTQLYPSIVMNWSARRAFAGVICAFQIIYILVIVPFSTLKNPETAFVDVILRASCVYTLIIMCVWMTLQQLVFAQTRNIALPIVAKRICQTFMVLFFVTLFTTDLKFNTAFSIKSLAEHAPYGFMYWKTQSFTSKTGISLGG